MGPLKKKATRHTTVHKLRDGVVCKTARSTRSLGVKLGRDLALGKVVALLGPLGAGKTTLVQGLADGFGVEDLTQVTSPSYTLVNEYPSPKGTLIHIDLYRMENPAAILALGLDDYLGRPDALVVIEWAERMAAQLPPDTVRVEIIVQVSGVREIRILND